LGYKSVILSTGIARKPRDLASAPLETEGSRELLQQRIALFARVSLLLSVLIQFMTRWVAAQDRSSPYAAEAHWSPNVHLLVLLFQALIWWRTRSGQRSAFELAWLDAIGPLIPIAFSLAILWLVPPLVQPSLLNVIGASFLLMLRAVLIPSSGLRTAVLGGFVCAVQVSWTYAYHARFDPDGPASPLTQAVMAGTWSAMMLIVSTLASHTIFGLRQRVRAAAQLGQYTLLRKIGAGGMGVVYEAQHMLLRRRTAVKLLPAERAGEESIARFEREVRLTSVLTHPNTIAVYDYGRSPEGVFYYAMEYLDGIDLQQLVERTGPQAAALVVHVLSQVCGALHEAHSIGLIHRDIKPANIVLCERGGMPCVAKVVDFGLVKQLEAARADVGLSVADAILGTPLYLSPEAIQKPDGLDGRSDLYALGGVAYFLLTGTPVFTGSSVFEVCAQQLQAAPLPPSVRLGRALPADLEAVVLACLQKEAGKRPQSAKELAGRLAATTASQAFTTQAAEAAWEQCRAIIMEREGAQDGGGLSASARALTVELRGRPLAQ
jgi:eukaryotic-like serine/threonine-protein kinase